MSKGYGFIRFFDEAEQKDALTHMNNYVGLGLKPLKVRTAVPKNPNFNEFQQPQQVTEVTFRINVDNFWSSLMLNV